MGENGVPIERIINGGGIPQRNAVLNQVYADVLGKPVLVPDGIPTGFGAGIFAGMAAGFYPDVAAARAAICLPFKTVQPRPQTRTVYDRLYAMFKEAYFAFGTGAAAPSLSEILPYLRRIASGHTAD
jgi:L-ribulokinase